MSESLKKFLEAVSGNAELAEKLKSAKSAKEIAELAKALGFNLTEADFKTPEGEVSDDELEGVAGGIEYCNCSCSKFGEGIEDPHYICLCYEGGTGITQTGLIDIPEGE